jgi:hypothetical protein
MHWFDSTKRSAASSTFIEISFLVIVRRGCGNRCTLMDLRSIVEPLRSFVLELWIVNPEEVQREREQWSTWPEQQVLAEQEMDETRDS